jgi:hypothetical protein
MPVAPIMFLVWIDNEAIDELLSSYSLANDELLKGDDSLMDVPEEGTHVLDRFGELVRLLHWEICCLAALDGTQYFKASAVPCLV